MSKEIDWPMTVGTLLLAAFLAWVTLAMYRSPLQTRSIRAWLHSSNVPQQVTTAQTQPAPARHP